jgi:NADH-quinone oxidoreductase subunit B
MQGFSEFRLFGAFLAIGVLLAMLPIAIPMLIAPRSRGAKRDDTYECGIDPVGNAWMRFSIAFHLFALIFIAFEVATFHRPSRWPTAPTIGRNRAAPESPVPRSGWPSSTHGAAASSGGGNTTAKNPIGLVPIEAAGISHTKDERPPVHLALLEDLLNQARARSLWPLTFGLACCAIEMMAAAAARFDLDRFGAGVFRPSPRQADVMIIAGTISRKMGPVVKALWEQMPAPKWAIAMGGCAIDGGPFKYPNQYAIVEGADQIIPVDGVPGCPPRPEALIAAILQLEEKIKAGGRSKAK